MIIITWFGYIDCLGDETMKTEPGSPLHVTSTRNKNQVKYKFFYNKGTEHLHQALIVTATELNICLKL